MFSLLGVSWFTDDVLSIWIVIIVLCLILVILCSNGDVFSISIVVFCCMLCFRDIVLFIWIMIGLCCLSVILMFHYCFVYLDYDWFVLSKCDFNVSLLFCLSGLWLVCAVSSKCDFMFLYCFVYLGYDCFILFPIIDISCFTLVTILAIMRRAFTFLLSNTISNMAFR